MEKCSFACLYLNGMVVLKVAGNYCLKYAKFIQCQIKLFSAWLQVFLLLAG